MCLPIALGEWMTEETFTPTSLCLGSRAFNCLIWGKRNSFFALSDLSPPFLHSSSIWRYLEGEPFLLPVSV